MLKKKLQPGLYLLVLFITCLLIPATVSANTPKDITQEGVNFLTDPPTEKTVYTAGNGTVTYEPAQNGQGAVVTLENATINGCQSTHYEGRNPATAAILMGGNVDMVLMGENKITVTNEYAYGLFCYNGNLNVKGCGSLTIDIRVKLNGSRGISILNGKDAADDMGNFTLTEGNITLSLLPNDYFYCLSAGKDVIVEEGALSIKGGSCSVVSIKGDINIRNATVSCKDFDNAGLYTFNGDIVVEGENTDLNIGALKDEPYSFGVYAEGQSGSPAILINGGTVDILAGQSGIYTGGGGNITISGGRVSTKAENTAADISAVGLWATGKVNVTGGTVYASGVADTGVGIYSDVSIAVSGGDVTAKGTLQAISHVPDTGEYENPVIMAAPDFEGDRKEAFSAEKLESYRYLHISSGYEQYKIHYENGSATITAAESAEVVVIFAAYDDSKRLIDLEMKEISLSKGENVISTEHFTPGNGKIKVMLWDSMSYMIPICCSETF